MSKDFIFNIDANGYIRKLNNHMKRTMARIVLMLEKSVKLSISKGNLSGNTPSRPGEPPRVRTGTLRANVSTQVTKDSGDTIGSIGVRKGPADRYAPLLEEKGIRDGTKRPFLRPAILKNRAKIIKMMRD